MTGHVDNSLWPALLNTVEIAQKSGHLITFKSRLYVIESDGIDFLVRLVSDLSTKKPNSQSTKPSQPTNPFLPPEPQLWVQSLGDTHNLILNKYSVIPNHGLITTKAFVPQTDQLQLDDFKAVEAVLRGVDGLVFYNGGEIAGASQPHRHFQIVAKDLGAGTLPIEAKIKKATQYSSASIFPFKHRLCLLPDYRSETLLDTWLKLEFSWQPYNLLITRDWMLVIPRRLAQYDGISVNSLGFAGALLVTNQKELAIIREKGPIALLHQVCFDDR